MEVPVKTLARLVILLGVVFAMSLFQAPAHAQFMQGQGGGDMMTMMTMMAPMMGMMKKKIGKRRFGRLMRTVGPMAVSMMNSGGGLNGAGFSDWVPVGGADYDGPNMGVPGGTPIAAGYSPGMMIGAGGYDGGVGNFAGMEQLMSNGTIQGLIGMATSTRGGHRTRHRHRASM
jgi:hypothetical protein